MIKLNASLSKKVPIKGTDFSSQSYGAGLEVEVADTVSAEEIQEKLRRLYGMLEASVAEQIAGGTAPQAPRAAKTQPEEQEEAPEQKPAPAESGKGDATPKMLALLEKLVEERKTVLSDEDREQYLSATGYRDVKGAIDALLAVRNPKKGQKKPQEAAKRDVEIKNPRDAVSEAQRKTIEKLLNQKGISGEEADAALAVATKGEASEQIKKLLAVPAA